MGWFMHHIGIGLTCSIRAAIGIFLFWYVSNLLVGRRIFLRKSKAAKYERFIARTDRPAWCQWLVNHRATFSCLEAMFILVVTSAVVGNNINAAIVYFHSHP